MVEGRVHKSHYRTCLLSVLLFSLLVCGWARPVAGELRVPASTAYIDPDVRGARVSGRSGITGWDDPALKVLWFGQIKTVGKLDCSVLLKMPEGATSKLRLTVAGQAHDATVKGAGAELVTASFGSFNIAEAGYHARIAQFARSAVWRSRYAGARRAGD